MATEHFCLRWNNHQSTLVSVFDNLLESGTLVDCTLAADGRYLKAHKVVLSACSTYLGMLLSQHHDKHPIIILKDVKFDELKAMLDYMYRGEVNISQEQLSTFLKAAESLQIKGLTDTGGEDGNGLLPNRPPSSSSTTSLTNDDPQSPREGGSPIPRKRKRNKHTDDPPDNEAKVSISDEIDRASLESGLTRTPTNTGSPSAIKNVSFGTGSVKREPTDGEGDGQMSVDDSGESAMMARPGPSNGNSTNNKGSPWILSADSTGEEMQLTPGQDGDREDEESDTEVMVVKNDYSEEFVNDKEEISSELNPPTDDLGFKQIISNTFSSNKTIEMQIYNDSKEGELIVPDVIELSGKYDLPQRSAQYFYIDQSKMVTVSSEDKNSISNQSHEKLYDQSLTFSRESVLYSGPRYLQPKNLRCYKKVSTLSSDKSLSPSSSTPLASLDEKLVMLNTKPKELLSKFRKILPAPPPSLKNQISKVALTQPSQKYNSEKEKDPSDCNIKSSDSFLNKANLSNPPIKKPNPSDYTSLPTPVQPHLSSSNQSMQNMSVQIQPHYTNPISKISTGCEAHQVTSPHQSNSNRLIQGNHLMMQPELAGLNPQTSTSNITTFLQPQFSISNQPVTNQSVSENSLQAFVQPHYQTISQSMKNQNIVISQQPFSISPTVYVTSSGASCTRESSTGLMNSSVPDQSSFIHQSSSLPYSRSIHFESPTGQLNSTTIPQHTLSATPQNASQNMQVLYMRPAASEDLYVQNIAARPKRGRPRSVPSMLRIRPRK